MNHVACQPRVQWKEERLLLTGIFELLLYNGISAPNSNASKMINVWAEKQNKI